MEELFSPSEIGGYLDISANMPHNDNGNYRYALNAARFCLEYIISQRGYKEIFLPYYGCHTLTKAVTRAGATVRYYNIDENFFPIIKNDIGSAPLLYINYYGVMTSRCVEVSKLYETVIIDNAQALYAPPILGCDCIYSPRKFFALPDGGFIVPDAPLREPDLEVDVSYQRMEHMLRRIDCGAEDAFAVSTANRLSIQDSYPKKMSRLTHLMFSQVDLPFAAKRRVENWRVLRDALSRHNDLIVDVNDGDVPLFYPFVTKNDKLRGALNETKIFTPTYWPGVDAIAGDDSFDVHMVKYMHPLPIDQRYTIDDMNEIASFVTKYIG